MSTTDSITQTLLFVVLVVLLVPVLVMAFAMPMMGAGWGHAWNGTGTGGAGWVWIGSWLLLLLVVLGGGLVLFRSLSGAGGGRADPALEELRVAYARGELTSEEYEERRSRLEREGE